MRTTYILINKAGEELRWSQVPEWTDVEVTLDSIRHGIVGEVEDHLIIYFRQANHDQNDL